MGVSCVGERAREAATYEMAEQDGLDEGLTDKDCGVVV